MFEKIPARAMSDHVAQQLLKQIEVGSFSATGKLPTEAVLAQEFGVSRTVIREAISRLKNEGVVEPRGSGVREPARRDPAAADRLCGSGRSYVAAAPARGAPRDRAEVAAEAALNHR